MTQTQKDCYLSPAEQIARDYKNRCITSQGFVLAVLRLQKGRVNLSELKETCLKLGLRERAYYQAIEKLMKAGQLPVILNSKVEQRVRDRIHSKMGGLKGVITSIGKIDVLTHSEIIEVSQVEEWKPALSRVLAFGAFYPDHKKHLHLLHDSPIDLTKFGQIQRACLELDVVATFEEVV